MNNSLVLLQPDELTRIVAEAVRLAIVSASVEMRTKDEILTKEEAAKYLRVSLSTLKRFMSDPDFPVCYAGSSPRFKRSELDLWMRKER